ncbi:MAG: hypothetical protein V2A79_14930 [Planctomycetota bacterium]
MPIDAAQAARRRALLTELAIRKVTHQDMIDVKADPLVQLAAADLVLAVLERMALEVLETAHV